ncbi:Cysteine-rich receptor-like protein kinase [Musa troglodytarum]|uniref:Cysteine-rich receptor-like protein kinase n=1 Tax=Musa troglodytarum TaxID=320322 RepID=A0A9E7KNA6_9LILI|nr:Cysteine-rich receptor-like protein kinase [Musa troglodytarum]
MLPSISSTQFLLFYLILLFVPSRTVAYRWQICSTSDGHFTDNSTYEANLNLLLSSLVSNGSGSGFSTGTVGRVPNQVQGLVLCRGDTNATTCGSCLSNGAVEIRQICAYDRDAVVWYDECLLRFSNLQFLSTSDNDPTAALENVNQVNDDPDRFNKVVTELLDSTADWAAYNSTKRYATGQAFNVTPAFPTIYALAQCTPDMSASDCRNCLEGVSQGLPMARMGARNQGVRCNLRYESSLFFQGNPIIRLISPVTNATTPAENATTPASAPTSHPAVGPIGKEDQTDSEQATQVIESLLFRLATLRVATVNFAEANKLGEDAVRGKQLTWGIRYKIICGIARGLLYLHEESQLKIIHRDLKASNILLDADMNPKISDFGLAKLFDIDQTQGTTNRVMGTFGYMAPEYVMRGKFSIKSDVFSFGVLVLEILTGRKSNGSYNPEVTEVLLSYKTIVAISISAVSAVLLIPIIYICYRRLRKQTSKSPYGSESEQAAQAESLLFQISALRIATANFSEENKLGEGGFGAVYKGVLPDGREIAVKRLLNSGHGLGELKNELVLVAKLRHRNLVKLLGVCLEEEKMIVYEYVPNTSLDNFLFEYVMHGKYSIKSDVFGFGVLVLEILTGRKSSGSYNPEVIEVLLSYFLLLYLILLFAPSPTVAFTWQVCSTSAGNFTANSTYESNVNLLLSSLVSNGSAPGFFTDTVGRIPNQVQGLVLCRGDTNATTCSPCLSKGAVEILQLCAYDKDAVVWYDECLLRFSNLQFLSTSDNDPTVALENEIAVNDEADRFNKVVNELLDSTADWAAYNSTKRYATGLAFNVTLAFPTIYALAQCTPDMSASDCRQCLEGVSQGLPMARMGARNQGVRCNLRYESSPFFHGNPIIRLISPATNATTPAENATTPASAPAFRPSVGSTSKEGKKKTILAISISAVSAVLLLSIIYACSMRLRKQILKPPYATDSEQATQVESLLFDLSTLRVATVNFSEENKLGEGGFGAVYKGVLPDGRVIAVKRLLNSGQGLGELKNELALVAKLQHRNLVKLLGVCLEEEKMIVYEYVPNTSLDKFLFDPVRGEQLTWGIRYKIICGIARGLLYLHEESQLKIIHRDLKACNILLDADMNPKISDFGSAKLFDGEQTQGMTSRVVGTYGYMAPEYVIHGQFSIKSDVFSFGVLVLEILTGRKNSTTCNPENTEDLLSYTWEKWRGGLALEMVDPALGNQFHGSDLLRCIQIGLLCVQENPFSRPTMSTITVMLNTVLLLSMRNPGAEGDGVVIEELLSMRTTDAVVKGNGMDTNRSSSIIHPCVGVSKEAVISPSGRIFCGGAATAEGVNGGGEASLAFVLRHVELAKRLAEDLVWGTPCRSVREAGGDGGRGEGREEEVEVGMVGAVGGKVGVCWTTFP